MYSKKILWIRTECRKAPRQLRTPLWKYPLKSNTTWVSKINHKYKDWQNQSRLCTDSVCAFLCPICQRMHFEYLQGFTPVIIMHWFYFKIQKRQTYFLTNFLIFRHSSHWSPLDDAQSHQIGSKLQQNRSNWKHTNANKS